MQNFFEFLLGSLVALFPIVDPIGSIPIFLALTTGASKPLRRQLALRIALYVVMVLATFLLVGGGILRFFGISLAVVRIAGGIVLFNTAWASMQAQPKLSTQDSRDARQKGNHLQEIAFMPMTIPLLAGPGAIAVTLGISAQAGDGFSIMTIVNLLAALLAIFIIGVVVYLCLRSANLLSDLLGASGIRAISRVLGLLILAIGVQLILNGVEDWLNDLETLQALIWAR